MICNRHVLSSPQKLSLFLTVALCLGISDLALAGPRVGSANEDALRAAVIMGIVRYTSWHFATGERLHVCLSGVSNSFRHLERLQDQRLPHSKPLHFSRTAKKTSKKVEGVAPCDVLVLGAESHFNIESIPKSSSCLVICNACGEKKKYAAVTLRMEDKRIRFDVDLVLAKQYHVQFGAPMLELAARVEGHND